MSQDCSFVAIVVLIVLSVEKEYIEGKVLIVGSLKELIQSEKRDVLTKSIEKV
jgi:hypothetical protein